MAYRHPSVLGDFKICQRDGYWTLNLQNTRIGQFLTPEDAARAVCEHNTGYKVWDTLKFHEISPFGQWQITDCPCDDGCIWR